jgi:hypothetical protein
MSRVVNLSIKENPQITQIKQRESRKQRQEAEAVGRSREL